MVDYPNEMQAVILAGGLATRLGDLTKDHPKSMIKILSKPFMEYQLESLRKGGIKDIVICIGHLGEQIEGYFGDGRKHAVNIRYSYEDDLLGTAGALKKAEPLLGDIFFTMYGDSYLFLDFAAVMRYFQSQRKLALMTVYKNQGRFDSSNTVVDGDLVKRYSKREKSADMVYIDYGVTAFRKEALRMVPENQCYGLEDLFPQLIEKKELLAFAVKNRFYEVGSPKGLEDFEKYMEKVAR